MNSEPLVLEAHGKHAQAVHFTKDGKELVTCGQDALVRVWTVPGFKPKRTLAGHEKSVNTLAFTADGKRLVTSASDGTVRAWSYHAGECEFVLEKQLVGTISPDGEHLVTISNKNEVILWDGQSGAQRKVFAPFDKRHTALAFAQSGLFLFVGGMGPIHRVALPDGTSDGQHKGHQITITCLAPSPNPAILASTGADGTLRFWTVVGGDEVNCVKLDAKGVLQLAFHPDGRSIAVATEGAILRLTAPDGAPLARLDVPVKGVYGLAFSPDGRFLANAAADGRVRVWSL